SALLTQPAWADAYKLNSGETLNGEVLPTSANDQGVQVKFGEGQYQRVPWANFSQEDLKSFLKNQRMEPFVEPFIEPDPQAKIKRTEVHITEPPRLERPARQALFGAMFSSSVGVFLMLVLYGANIYAGFEVAIFRARKPALVCGLAAIPGLGLFAPIAFLAMPTDVKPSERSAEPALPEAAPQAVAQDEEDVNPMHGNAAHPSSLKLAAAEAAKSTLPETVTYKRGQFTFNRRFIETKFAGFFGVVRRDADRDMVLVFKASRGEYTAQRISRIAANDLHVQVQRGPASEEVMIPFQEIQEIRLQHKDA
ncbi:MAG: hypothetical protein ACREIC_28060, partial [Limisphaerales bacterium]